MQQKNILIVTDWLYPNMNANSEIAYRIATVLKEQFMCNVAIVGYETRKPNDNEIMTRDKKGLSTLVMKYTSAIYCHPEWFRGRKNWRKQFFLHPIRNKYMFLSKIKKRIPTILEYMDVIKKELREKRYDCIIGFFVPAETLLALEAIETKVPFIAYELDSWYKYVFRNDSLRLENEMRVNKCANSIITSRLLYKDFLIYADSETIEKTYCLEFPNIIHYDYQTQSTIYFGNTSINCAFAGGLYLSIRNPKYVIDLFEKINSESISFHIFGHQYQGECIPNPLPENVYYHGRIPTDEAMAVMQSADILVNIGNTELNLLPSKILTYISLGKPILNIIKDPNCPTLPYIEKYPLALTVLETPEPTEEDVKRVRDFIMNSKGKRIPFETIKELYYDCTPEYVGGKVYEIICKVVDENKRSKKQ